MNKTMLSTVLHLGVNCNRFF